MSKTETYLTAEVEVLRTRFNNEHQDWSGDMDTLSYWSIERAADIGVIKQNIEDAMRFADFGAKVDIEDAVFEYEFDNRWRYQCMMEDYERDEGYILDVLIYVYEETVKPYYPKEQTDGTQPQRQAG